MKVKLKGSNDSNIIKRICDNRNIDYSILEEYLCPDVSYTKNPFIYKNMELAIKLYLSSIKSNKRIGVLVDSDCDGFCSAATLVNYSKDVLNFNNFRYFIHSKKAHGLTPEIMNEVLNSDIEVLIIPDAGSNDYEEHRILNLEGIAVIVLDHHLSERYSNNAIVINNQLDPLGNKSLSGAGIVLKFLEAIDLELNIKKAQDYLDLVAVAIVADCIKIDNPETRYYVQKGMATRNNELISSLYRPGKVINYDSISFEVAPIINAFSRVATYNERVELFQALIGNNETRSIIINNQELEIDLIGYINKLGNTVKNRQTSIVNHALKSKETKILTDDLPITICILGDNTAKDVTGLLANKLVDEYKKPCMVIYLKDGVYKGSGRTTETFNNFKDFLINTDKFIFCEGHQEAFGLAIEQDKLDSFIRSIENIDLGEDHIYYSVDGIYKDTVSAWDILQISQLNNSYCRGFERPQFYIELTKPVEIEIIGIKQNTIRIKHDTITYIKFKCSNEEIEAAKNIIPTTIKMIGHFNTNLWNDREYPQVIIQKLEIEGHRKPQETVDLFGFGLNW